VEYSDGTVLQVCKYVKNASESVQISGIPPNMTKDVLVMILENKKRFGGGKVAEIQCDEYNRTARVAFEDHEGKHIYISSCSSQLLVVEISNSKNLVCQCFFKGKSSA